MEPFAGPTFVFDKETKEFAKYTEESNGDRPWSQKVYFSKDKMKAHFGGQLPQRITLLVVPSK